MFTERKTRCPLSKTVLEQEKGSFNCLGTTDVYHCLLDERNRSGEICHQPIWVPKEFCPQYNTGAKDINIVPCNIWIGCPDVPYRSNEVFKYPVCLNKTNTNYGGGIPEGKESSSVSPWIFVAIAIAVILAVVCFIVCCIIRRKDKNKKYDCELEPLRVEHEIPLGFKKTIDYLNGGVFSVSKTYEHAIALLDVYRCITIIGPPGSGKTTTAVRLAFRRCGLSNPYFCQTVEEILVIAKKNKCVYIIVDDWIDEYVYYPSKIGNAIALFSSVYENFILFGNVRLILTAQEDKWMSLREFFKSCPLFRLNSILVIPSQMFTTKQKRNMIICHCKHLNIIENTGRRRNTSIKNSYDVDKITEIYMAKNIEDEKEFSFPSIIDLIYNNERLRSSKSKQLILKDGFSRLLKQFFINWLNDKDIEERRSFCVLVFAALLGGEVSLADFHSPKTGPLFDKICNQYKCPISAKIKLGQKISEQEIEKLLGDNERLRGCLYRTRCRQNDTMFIFHHSSLFRFVLSFIKDKEEIFFIENVHVEVLLKHCWIEAGIVDKLTSQKNFTLKPPVGSVILSTGVIKTLAARICSEKRQGYTIPDWYDHIFMCHRTFQKIWETVDLQTQHSTLMNTID